MAFIYHLLIYDAIRNLQIRFIWFTCHFSSAFNCTIWQISDCHITSNPSSSSSWVRLGYCSQLTMANCIMIFRLSYFFFSYSSDGLTYFKSQRSIYATFGFEIAPIVTYLFPWACHWYTRFISSSRINSVIPHPFCHCIFYCLVIFILSFISLWCCYIDHLIQ